MREDDPKPVGALAGHQDGITFIDSKVGRKTGLCSVSFTVPKRASERTWAEDW